MVQPTRQRGHSGSVPYLRRRSTQSASLLNSPQSGTFHYLSTFLHIHSIGLHQRGKGLATEEGRGLRRRRVTGVEQEIGGMLVRERQKER